MTRIREIRPAEWEAFLREFNGRNYARPVRLKVTTASGRMPARDWTAFLAVHQPLAGVALDPRGSAGKSITVALGGLEAGMPQFTHVIARPTRVRVEEQPRGRTRRLTIESGSANRISLVFEPAAVWPERNKERRGDEACELIEDPEPLGIGA